MRYLLLLLLLPLCLPAFADDWVAKGAPKAYTPKALYEYIDGAADLYLAYGFAGLEVTEYTRGSEDRVITAEVYDMGEPINAFGIFASERPEGAEELRWPGPQGYQDINLAFWQDRYYVKVLSLSERDTAAQWELAKAVSERLPSVSGPPSELGLLPATNRLAGSERYVRQSALGHKFLERVVSAEYRLGKETAALHVADLRTPEEGEKAWRKLRDFASKVGKYFSPTEGAGEEGFVVRDSSLGLVIAARQGRYLVIATSPKATRATLLAFLKETVGKLSKERTAASAQVTLL